MAKKPKKEVAELQMNRNSVELVNLLELNSFISKAASPAKDNLIADLCGKLGIEYKDDGPYEITYHGKMDEVEIDILSWSSSAIPWKQRYEVLLDGIMEILSGDDELVGKVAALDKAIQNDIVGERKYKPMVKVLSSEDPLKHPLDKLASLLQYWCATKDTCHT